MQEASISHFKSDISPEFSDDFSKKRPEYSSFKKMFKKVKNSSSHIPTPYQNSLLFSKKQSAAMLKAFKNRKRKLLQEGGDYSLYLPSDNAQIQTIDQSTLGCKASAKIRMSDSHSKKQSRRNIKYRDLLPTSSTILSQGGYLEGNQTFGKLEKSIEQISASIRSKKSRFERVAFDNSLQEQNSKRQDAYRGNGNLNDEPTSPKLIVSELPADRIKLPQINLRKSLKEQKSQLNRTLEHNSALINPEAILQNIGRKASQADYIRPNNIISQKIHQNKIVNAAKFQIATISETSQKRAEETKAIVPEEEETIIVKSKMSNFEKLASHGDSEHRIEVTKPYHENDSKSDSQILEQSLQGFSQKDEGILTVSEDTAAVRENIKPKMPQKFQYKRSPLKNSRSNLSISKSSTQKVQLHFKGYLTYHPEAKRFFKQYKKNLKKEPKMKSYMISGLTAKSFAAYDSETLTPIICKNNDSSIEIASVSKVMTCYLCLLVCRKYKVDFRKHNTRVSDRAASMKGTSATLEGGDTLTIEELLYGLMLPSGNDASVALAEAVGKVIIKNKQKQTKKTPYDMFIYHMNMLAKELKLEQTWRNPSGLQSHPNYSTPRAISCLTALAMKMEEFKNIVNTQEYEVSVKNQRFGLKRTIVWKNTNKLLFENAGWEGVKTGTTYNAGHCLMAKNRRYLISVYDCQQLSLRFVQTAQIFEFLKKREDSLFPPNVESQSQKTGEKVSQEQTIVIDESESQSDQDNDYNDEGSLSSPNGLQSISVNIGSPMGTPDNLL